MTNRTVFTLLVFVLFSTQSYAQDLSNLNPQLVGGFEPKVRQARVEALPTDFFAEEVRTYEASASDNSATAAQNMLVLFSLGTLLVAGSVITAFCVINRRRSSNRASVAPPVKLYV